MKAGALIQARMGSSRLPGKMLEKLGSLTLIEWVFERVARSSRADFACLLTSNEQENEDLVRMAEKYGFLVIQGDENNVLSRFLTAAKKYPADHYLRICADNPFICPIEIDRLVDFHGRGGFDYSFNHIPKLGNDYADGFGCEALSAATLLSLESKPDLTRSNCEHVTSYLWERRDEYKIGVLRAPEGLNFPGLRFDVDTKEDLEKLRSLAATISVHSPATEIVRAYLNTCG
jgi:spore coat polysaccharide biosynthesis protein SpsF